MQQENEVSLENTQSPLLFEALNHVKPQKKDENTLSVHNKMDKFLSGDIKTHPQEQRPQVSQQPQTPTQEALQNASQPLPKGHSPFIKVRNTGVDYFDKKKNLTLLDALLAKNLDVNLNYQLIENKVDLDADLKQRQIQGSDVAKRQKQLMELTNGIINHANNVKEGQGVMNWLARSANNVTGGFINVSATNNKIMANEKTLGNQLADIMYQGRSTEKERERMYDLVKFKGRSKEQINSNLLEMLKLVGDNYYQNLQDFSNRGFVPSDEMVQDYYKILNEINTLQKQILK